MESLVLPFVSNSRVLVTGGNGFLGRHLVARLENVGCKEVLAPSRREFNLTEQLHVRDMLRQAHPDIVVNLAATVGGIGANRLYPGRYCYENLIMGAMLLEESRLAGVKKFVNVGTICSYPKLTPVPFKEEDLWNGYPEETNAPYGLAKKVLLVQGQAYRQQYGFNSIYLMPVNLFGPGDKLDPQSSHVIPALIVKCLEAMAVGVNEIEVWGDGTATREFLFVDDAARAILLASERYDGEEPVNIGSGHEVSIRDLVEIISRLVGFTGTIRWNTSLPNGQPRRCLDTSRAKRYFGFESKVTLEDGLRQTIEWYRQCHSDGRTGDVIAQAVAADEAFS